MVRAANEKSTTFYIGLFVCFVIGSLLIYHDLGVIAFVMLVFVGIWGFGLREKFSNETTGSAYSVFNEDGRSIVGGFTSSQFESQLRGVTLMGRNSNQDDPLKGPIAEARKEKSAKTSIAFSDAERTARRKAAAAAAERRLMSSKEE